LKFYSNSPVLHPTIAALTRLVVFLQMEKVRKMKEGVATVTRNKHIRHYYVNRFSSGRAVVCHSRWRGTAELGTVCGSRTWELMLSIRRREYHDGIDNGLLVIMIRAVQPGKHVGTARTVRRKKCHIHR